MPKFSAEYSNILDLVSPRTPALTHSTTAHSQQSLEVETMKMNQQSGNIVTQFFAWLATIAAALGWTTQDFVYFIFGAIGVVISLLSFVLGRIDARYKKREEAKRTKIIEDMANEAKKVPLEERHSAIKVLSDAAAKADS